MKLTRYAALCVAAIAMSACGGDGGSKSEGANPKPRVYASRWIDYLLVNSQGASPVEWPYFFQPNAALGAPGGMLDVASLGYDPAAPATLGGSITMGIGDGAGPRCIVDGPGHDLVVYENAFRTVDVSGNPGTNNEVAVVAVSTDNLTWHDFPHSIGSGNLIDPANYTGFAGIVPGSEGGDRFDLATLISAHSLSAGFQACYVRITDGGTAYPDYGNTQTDLYASGADIDTLEALHSIAAPSLSP